MLVNYAWPKPPSALFHQPVSGSPTRSNQPTVFIDRDGVINHNRAEHVLHWQDFKFLEGALVALARLRQAGYRVVVITNQAAIERGLVSAHQVEQLHTRMTAEIEAAGGAVQAVLYCPHRPEAGCNCRKPRPGLLYQAAAHYRIRLNESWLIGDYLTDIEAGLAANCKPVLDLTGRGQVAWQNWSQHPLHRPLPVKQDLLEAVNYILEQ